MTYTKPNHRQLERAISLARLSQMRQKHGAVIVRGGRILGVGINTERNSPAVKGIPNGGFSQHAEMNALRGVSREINLKNASIYVARISSGGNIANSRPCRDCQIALSEAGITKIFYT